MPYPLKVSTVWEQPIGKFWDSEPITLFACQFDKKVHVLVGQKGLAAFDVDGKRKWFADLDGNVSTIISRLTMDGTTQIVVGTGSFSDTLLSSANFIHYYTNKGHLYFLDTEGNIKQNLNFDHRITKIIDLGIEGKGEQFLLAGSNNDGYHPCGVLYVIGENGRIAWSQTIPGGIASLQSLNLGGETLVLCGTYTGECVCHNINGKLIWKQPAKSGDIIQILSSKLSNGDGSIYLLGGGSICVLALDGTIKMKIPCNGSPVGFQIFHSANENELDLLVIYRKKVELQRLGGEVLWSTSLDGWVRCHDFLGEKELGASCQLVFTDKAGVVLNSRSGTIIDQVPVRGKPLACRSYQGENQSGWLVCESDPTKSVRCFLFGENNANISLLSLERSGNKTKIAANNLS